MKSYHMNNEDVREESKYDTLFQKLCKMPGYPCKNCPNRSKCANACGDWFDWFAWTWRSIQRKLGKNVPDLYDKPAFKPDRTTKRL